MRPAIYVCGGHLSLFKCLCCSEVVKTLRGNCSRERRSGLCTTALQKQCLLYKKLRMLRLIGSAPPKTRYNVVNGRHPQVRKCYRPDYHLLLPLIATMRSVSAPSPVRSQHPPPPPSTPFPPAFARFVTSSNAASRQSRRSGQLCSKW